MRQSTFSQLASLQTTLDCLDLAFQPADPGKQLLLLANSVPISDRRSTQPAPLSGHVPSSTAVLEYAVAQP